jgi:hypothetical protein
MNKHEGLRSVGYSDPHAEPKHLTEKRWNKLLERCRNAQDREGRHSDRAIEDWDEIMRCVEACRAVDRMRRVGWQPDDPQGGQEQ